MAVSPDDLVLPVHSSAVLRAEVATRVVRVRRRRRVRRVATRVVLAGVVTAALTSLVGDGATHLPMRDPHQVPAEDGSAPSGEATVASGSRGPRAPGAHDAAPDLGGRTSAVPDVRPPGPGTRPSPSTTAPRASQPVEPLPASSNTRFLFVRDAKVHELPSDGSAPRVLVPDAADQAAWSPDGASIAYTSMNAATGARRTSLAHLRTGERRVVLEFPEGSSIEPAWSPDGRTIAVTHVSHTSSGVPGTEPAVWVVDVATGEHTRLASGRDPSWTPDGRILFDCDEGLCTMAADGSDRRSLPGTGDLRDAAWSPDGRWVAAVDRMSRLVVVALDGSDRRVLDEHLAEGPAWSRDGRLVYPVSPNAGCTRDCTADPGLWSIRSDGGDRRRLTDRSGDRSPAIT